MKVQSRSWRRRRLLSPSHAGPHTLTTEAAPPSTAIYDLFDGLILISEGKTIYLGPANRAVDHFAKMGYPCPPLYNQVGPLERLSARLAGASDPLPPPPPLPTGGLLS